MTDAFEVQADLSPAQSTTNETFVTETLALDAADVNDNEPIDAEITPEQPNGFVLLGLAPELVQAVADLGYTQPTPVQLKAIPLALPKETLGEAHRYIDLMVSSQTGSGKTAAFLLPVLHTLLQELAAEEEAERAAFAQACSDAAANGEPAPKRPKRKDPTNSRNFKAPTPGALIVCPTRELAQQVAHDAIDLVKHCRGLRVANIVGGMPYQLQIAKLQNANLVVATPGRLLDLQRSMQIKLDKVKFLVVDEADRMLDLGFSDDLADINQLTSQRQQTMMFSATFAPRIQQLAMRVMHDGGSSVQKIQIDSPQEKHSNIKQVLFWADNAQHKRKLLDHWLRDAGINQAIVFASTQIECDGLAADLQQDGFDAVALHGALSQGLRNRRLMALRNGQVQILVATDVAARGIDVPTITHVFNFGLPMKAEDYTHRIGRTGRAGRDGLAIT
ncbi:MAG: DEAD/DEAH box helicase, partial [Betaproteobacteria bacterium]